jgi:hypothetical protein
MRSCGKVPIPRWGLSLDRTNCDTTEFVPVASFGRRWTCLPSWSTADENDSRKANKADEGTKPDRFAEAKMIEVTLQVVQIAARENIAA